jgi:hypothetical protein
VENLQSKIRMPSSQACGVGVKFSCSNNAGVLPTITGGVPAFAVWVYEETLISPADIIAIITILVRACSEFF